MNDEEEYSYKGYSEQTITQIERAQFSDNGEEQAYSGYSEQTQDEIEGKKAQFIDNEEVFTYSGYAEDYDSEEYASSVGDIIVEELSAEATVHRIASFTKIPQTAVTCVVAAAYFIVGLLCVSITEQVTSVLPYIVSGMMFVTGLITFIFAMRMREYRDMRTNRTATSLILIALSVMILLQELDSTNDSALMLISIIWGVLGLAEGARAFNHAFKRIANKERCIYYLIKGLIECAVSFILLYRPDNHSAHHLHIIVFGINLMFDAIIMIPKVKEFFTSK